MNTNRNKKTGRFSGHSISGVPEKKTFAEQYFDKHSKTVINAMKKSKNLRLTAADLANPDKLKQIFANEFAYNPRNFNKKATATAEIKRQIENYRYGNAEFTDMKAEIANKDIDKRKIKHEFIPHAYNWSDDKFEYDSEGYWEISKSNKVIVKVNQKVIGEKSPWTNYLILDRSDIGLQRLAYND